MVMVVVVVVVVIRREQSGTHLVYTDCHPRLQITDAIGECEQQRVTSVIGVQTLEVVPN